MVILAQEFGSLLQSRLAGKLDLTFAARRWWDGRFFDHHNVGNSWDIYRLYLYESGWWIYGCTTDHVLELHFDGFSCANDRKCAVVWYIWWFDRKFQRASWALICWYLLFLYMNDPKWLGGMGATLHTHWTILQPSNVGMLWYGMLRELHIIPDHYIMICLDMLDFWGPLCMKHNKRPPAFFLVSCPLFLTRCQFFLDLGAHILVHNNIWEFTEIGMPQTRGCPTFKKKKHANVGWLWRSPFVWNSHSDLYIHIYYMCVWLMSELPASCQLWGPVPCLHRGELLVTGSKGCKYPGIMRQNSKKQKRERELVSDHGFYHSKKRIRCPKILRQKE